MKIIDNLNDFISQVDNMKKVNPMDLSSDQDLSIAIMNLISIEEHLFFSGAKTNDTSFYDLINPIREDRKELLKKIVKSYKGEVWCISKHLLAGCMRLIEVGTKTLATDNKEEAYQLFEKAYSLYALFWGLNINAITDEETKKAIEKIDKITIENIEKNKEIDKKDSSKDKGIVSKLKSFVSKAVDCCRE
jgi:DNA-binding cell septation regulator SpoVG